MSLDDLKLTRRRFLKVTGATLGALSLSHDLLDFKNWVRASAEAPVTRIPTFCNGCGNRCGIFAFVKNGRLWKIEGNPEANGNLGVICPKGHGYLHDLYNPGSTEGPAEENGRSLRTHLLGASL